MRKREPTNADPRNASKVEVLQARMADLLAEFLHRGFTGSVSLTCHVKEGFLQEAIKTGHEEHGRV
jgi:hypothetical protein